MVQVVPIIHHDLDGAPSPFLSSFREYRMSRSLNAASDLILSGSWVNSLASLESICLEGWWFKSTLTHFSLCYF
ncbi:MAG: hypothetical protein ACFFD4_07925 [Candidatus Odinarchaeota archaeon]